MRSKAKNDVHKHIKRQAKQNFGEQQKNSRKSSKGSSRFSFKSSYSFKRNESGESL